MKKGNINRYSHTAMWFIITACFWLSCSKKEAFLDAKPSSSLLVPSSLSDFQKLLDNTAYPNGLMNEVPAIGEVSAGDFWLTDARYSGGFLQPFEQNSYIWAADIYGGVGNIGDWNIPYKQVLNCNVVLEGLSQITPEDSNDQLEWNNLEGSALFFRSFAFYNLAQVYAPPYDSITSSSDLGVPLRLSSNINQKTTRPSVEATYRQIISDLKMASVLLPPSVSANYRNRPCRPAALALLARVYLSMRQYQNAFSYADSCLQSYGTLVDYNTLNPGNTPFSDVFPESLISCIFANEDALVYINFFQGFSMDTILYSEYSANDLRKTLYFKLSGSFILLNGKYTGYYQQFTGLATDEMYLIRAECYARRGDVNDAMQDLNTLLSYRYVTGTFTPLTASDASDALATILTERRKELVMRGLRWSDLRRLNKEGFNISLTRIIGGQTYTLSAGDPRWVLPIPPDVIALSGMPQNQR